MTTTRREPWVGPVRYRFGRRIGPWGTLGRLASVIGLLLWALAVPHEHPLGDLPGTGVLWWNLLLGLVLVPAVVTLAIGLRGRAAATINAGLAAEIVAVAVYLALVQVLPVAMLLALAANFAVQVVRGDGGCEMLAIPNWLLRRRDRLFCLAFTPIDALEARLARRRASTGARVVNSVRDRVAP